MLRRHFSDAGGLICVRQSEAYARYVKYLFMEHLEGKDDILDDYWRQEIITVSQHKRKTHNAL